jgi:NADH:ubiquinone oxidoreductase subunit K
MGFVAVCTLFIAFFSIIKNFKNNILLLLSLELFFIGIALLFLNSSFYLDDINGIITTLFILCLSATESAIGLTFLINLKKNF